MKVICSFAFNKMNIELAKFSTHGNIRDKTTTNNITGIAALQSET